MSPSGPDAAGEPHEQGRSDGPRPETPREPDAALPPRSPPAFRPRSREETDRDAQRWVPESAKRAFGRVPEGLLPASVAERLQGETLLMVVKPTSKAILAAALPFALVVAFVLLLPFLLGPASEFLFDPVPGPDAPPTEDGPQAPRIPFFQFLSVLEAPFFILLFVAGGRLMRNVGLLFTTYVVTEKEVVSHFSFLAERIRHVPHEKITDVRVFQGLIPRLLGYSDVTVEAYTQGARVEMRGVGPAVPMLHLLSDRARRATSIRHLLEAD